VPTPTEHDEPRTVNVRALRGVVVGPGRTLAPDECTRVDLLAAALLLDIGAVELVQTHDRPRLREALEAEARRLMMANPRPWQTRET
jgi:hypothetical protein